jgi:4'-phosphopantetheinyl transferase
MNDGEDNPPHWSVPPARPDLPAGEIQVFAFALNLSPSRLAAMAQLLSQDESERAERFRLARDRRRYAVGRAQLRMILGWCVGWPASRLEFAYGSHGKPALRGGNGDERIRFNMSRSHELAVIAVQLDEDLGIDLERIRRFPDALSVAKRFFAAPEHEALRSLPATELDAAFFRYWTRKEAVVKSVGLGLSQPMDAFTLALHPGDSSEEVVIVGDHGAASRWTLPVPPPSEGYVAALATAGAPRPLRCWFWSDPPARHQ